MALLELDNIEFNYSDKELYKDVCLKLNQGEHCVLVGANGTGKTTLLNMIVGELSPDKGKVLWEGGTTFSYLDQQLKVAQNMPVHQYLYGVYEDLFEKAQADYVAAMEENEYLRDKIEKLRHPEDYPAKNETSQKYFVMSDGRVSFSEKEDFDFER